MVMSSISFYLPLSPFISLYLLPLITDPTPIPSPTGAGNWKGTHHIYNNQSPFNSPFLETLREQAPLKGWAPRGRNIQSCCINLKWRTGATFPPPSRGRQEGIVKDMYLILAEYNPPRLPLTKREKYTELLHQSLMMTWCNPSSPFLRPFGNKHP